MRDLGCAFQSGFPVLWGNKHQPTFLRLGSLYAPLTQLFGGRFHPVPKVLPQPFVGQEERPWAPLPLPLHLEHTITWSLSPPPPLFLWSPPFFFFFFFFLMVVVIVSKVSLPLLLSWPPCQGSVSSSVTKAALDLGSLGREVVGSGSWSRCLSMVLLQPFPPLGTQMGFIQQTKPPPTQAAQARGPRPHRGKGVVTGAEERDLSKQVLFASLLFLIFHNPDFSP